MGTFDRSERCSIEMAKPRRDTSYPPLVRPRLRKKSIGFAYIGVKYLRNDRCR